MSFSLFRTGISCALAAVLVTVPVSLSAQEPLHYDYGAARALPLDRGSAAVKQDIQRLQTRGSLILIVAHPDDEDSAMLTYESRGQGVDTSMLTLNRGEGGQNIMSNDFWDRLGEVRTQELLAAGQYFGIHQYFTRVADYGFSKTLEEAMQQWGHDRVLYDVVRVIRMTRPMIVTAVFVGGVSDGHGHHQTSGEMAQEVFNAAGDPKVFPDQIAAGLQPWTPLKVYARAPFARVSEKGIFDYATGHYAPVQFHDYVHNTTIEGLPGATVSVSTGTYNPLLADSYTSIARTGLGSQKSQNGGTAMPLPEPSNSQYHLYASRVSATPPAHEDSFFDGIDTSLAGITSYAPADQRTAWQGKLKSIADTVQQAAAAYDATHPEKCAPAFAKGLIATEALLADLHASSLPADAKYNMKHELDIKRDQFNQALNDALGVSVIPIVSADGSRRGPSGPQPGAPPREGSFQSAIPGDTFPVDVHIADEGREAIQVVDTKLVSHSGDGWVFKPASSVAGALEGGKALDQQITATVPASVEITRPYFARKSVEQSYYDLLDPRYLNMPTMPYPLSAELTYKYGGAEAHVTGVVQTSHRYVGPGPTLEPLLIAPPISLTVSPQAGVVPIGNEPLHLQVSLRSSVKGAATGTLKLELPEGWTSEPATAQFSTKSYNEERIVNFTITPKNVQAKPYTITAVAQSGGHEYKDGFEMAGYLGVRPYPFYRPASYQATGVDLKLAPSLKVGYVMGTGDDVPQSLAGMGVHVTMLSPQDVSTGDLSAYDVIVLGVRSYAARPELARANSRLLAYANAGGTVIVQYQSHDFDHNYAPYAFTLNHIEGSDGGRVVEENGEASILDAKDPVLNWPNQITKADFDGWIEERGHGFPSAWGTEFIAPTEMHDDGEDPQKGGLLYARTGKGFYIYTAYAFFRQMPEGVPGSFRIMANLLSIGKNPQLTK